MNGRLMANVDHHRSRESSNFRHLQGMQAHPVESSTIKKERTIPECLWVREANRIVAEKYNLRIIAEKINSQSDPDNWANALPVAPQQPFQFSTSNLMLRYSNPPSKALMKSREPHLQKRSSRCRPPNYPSTNSAIVGSFTTALCNYVKETCVALSQILVLSFGRKRRYPKTFWEREMRVIRFHRFDPIPKRREIPDYSDHSNIVSEQFDPVSTEWENKKEKPKQ